MGPIEGVYRTLEARVLVAVTLANKCFPTIESKSSILELLVEAPSTEQPSGIEAELASTAVSQENHWNSNDPWVNSGNAAHTPLLALSVEPKLASPEIDGSVTRVGGWLVVEVTVDQIVDVPRMFVTVEATEMNFPASTLDWV
jgi:hypothetical protein